MILLDTHVVVWQITGARQLSQSVMDEIGRIEVSGMRPSISVATLFELFYLKRAGRVHMRDSDEKILAKLREAFVILPVTESIAVRAALLAENFHGDPMDRMITATAVEHDLVLATRDERIRQSGVCQTLW
jgi:PIN domain nuclease of toxin-antitoxin system